MSESVSSSTSEGDLSIRSDALRGEKTYIIYCGKYPSGKLKQNQAKPPTYSALVVLVQCSMQA